LSLIILIRKSLIIEILILILSFIFLKSLFLLQHLNLLSYLTKFSILDKINRIFFILLIFILIIRILASNFNFRNKQLNFNEILKIIFFILLIFFFSSSILSIYIYFELSILPIFLLIIGWGYQTERVRARLALIFYTIRASIPLLIFIFNNIYLRKIFIFRQIYFKLNINNIRFIFSVRVILAFLIKIPIFLGHLWLPKAHVEAPVVGSIILASILLKLGGYGVIRISPLLENSYQINIFLSISLTGAALIGLICINQLDLKVIIAYSSVAHIRLVIGGLLYISNVGLSGAIILIIAHGLSSSVIFFGGNVLYTRSFSRRVLLRKGILSFFPLLSFFWLLSILIRIAAPPIINLVSEILCIIRILSFSTFNIVWIRISIFLAGVYSMILYSRTQQSVFFSNKILTKTSLISEILVYYGHLFWGVIIILSLNCFF